MKKLTAWLLMCVLLLSVCPARAMTNEEALERVRSYLTEVYSYTAEEADRFEAHVELREEGWFVSFWHQEHPAWVYTAVIDAETEKVTNAVTPFYTANQFQGYPGEGAVREGLNRARKNGWFAIWEPHMQQALLQFITDWGIQPTARLHEGLATGGITAGNALHEYFVSCYGEEMKWTPELRQWHDAELEAFGLTPTVEEEMEITEGVLSYEGVAYNGQKTRALRFINEVPQEMEATFSHPKLTGWKCLCGAAVQNVSNLYGHGLAVFEKDGQRLLAALAHRADESDWVVSPVSTQALYADRDVYILPDPSTQREMIIVYPCSGTETERFEVTVASMSDGRLDAYIDRYLRMDEAAGSGIAVTYGSDVQAVVYEDHRQAGGIHTFDAVANTMSMVDIQTFPTTLEALGNAAGELIPEGYALCRGVHLRKKTSSRSRDLGEYHSGVLVKVLGMEKGDPDPWYHVQVGSAEGYMSSRYVEGTMTGDTAYLLSKPLPVAQAVKEICLKKGMSLLSGTVQKVPEGTQMQVLAECDGGWLHVNIPKREMAWGMDLDGTDGYVKKSDVRMGGTPLVLEWTE